MTRKIQDSGVAIMVDTNLVFPKPDQPRKHFNQESLRLLSRSIKVHGQENPAKIKPLGKLADGRATFQLIDGERRWRACAMIHEKLWAIVKIVNSDAEHFRSSVVSNLAGDPLSPIEIAYALARIQKDYPNMKQGDLSAMCCKSHGWSGQYLALLKLHPTVQEMMSPEIPKDDRLPFFVATSLAPLPNKDQLEIARNVRKHKWKTTRALQEIRERGRELGISSEGGKTPRKPADDYRLLLSFFRRMEGDANMLLGITPERFDHMFAPRSENERVAVMKSVRKVYEVLGLLNTRIRHASRQTNRSGLRVA